MNSAKIMLKLSQEQICDIADLPIALVAPDSSIESNEAWLQNFIDYLAGSKTFDGAINQKLDSGNFQDAFRLALQSEKNKISISSNTQNKLSEAWKKLIKPFNNIKSQSLNKLKKLTINEESIKEWASEIKDNIEDANLPLQYPKNEKDLESSFNVMDAIVQSQKDYEELEALNEEYRYENKEHYYKIVENAMQRFLNLVKSDSLPDDSHEGNIFKKLPDIVLSRNIQLLEKIADPEASLSEIILPQEPPSPTLRSDHPRLLRKIYVPSSVKPDSLKKLELSTFSESAYNIARATGKALSSPDEIENFRYNLESVTNMQDRANEWFGAAKSCSDDDIRYAAMGEGFLAYGLNQIGVKRYDHARKLLIDATICLISTAFKSEASIENAVIATLIAYVWPQFIGIRRNGEKVENWLDNPEYMFRLMKNGRFLNTVAKIWADEFNKEQVAEKFIEVVSANLGDDRTLFRICVERLLTPYNFMKRPERLVNGLKWLLRDAEPSDELLEELNRLHEQIEPVPDGQLSISSSRIITEIVDNILKKMETLSQGSVAPVNEIAEFLPNLVSIISKKDLKIHTSDPKVSVKRMVNIIYPDECQYDFEFPVMVRNSETAGTASDVVLTLRSEGEDKSLMPDITKNDLNMGDLTPGQKKEAVFFMNLPEGLTNKLGELLFKVEIRIGDKVKRQKLPVKIRPSNRKHKNSPYVTGLAVSGSDFIGRENEIHRLTGTLCGNMPNKAVAVYGIRRIGKTSILKQTSQHPDILKRFFVVFWDVEDRPLSDTSVDFLIEFCEKIRNVLPAKYFNLIDFHRENFRERPYLAFEEFIQSLQKIGLPKRILLMIDEFDKLLYLADQAEERQKNESRILGPHESFQPEIFAAIRKALMISDVLSLVIAGLPNIMVQQYEKRIFGLLEPLEVKAFNEKEAEQVILAGKGVIDFSPEAKEFVFEASGLHPYLLQIICNELFHKIKFTGRDIVVPFDVEDVIEEKILPNEKYFADYVSLIGNARDILYGLAKGHKRNRAGYSKFVSVTEIVQELARKGIEYETEYVLKVLESLLIDKASAENYRSLVERANNNPRRFKLVVGLLGEHLIRKGLNHGV